MRSGVISELMCVYDTMSQKRIDTCGEPEAAASVSNSK